MKKKKIKNLIKHNSKLTQLTEYQKEKLAEEERLRTAVVKRSDFDVFKNRKKWVEGEIIN